MAKDKETHEDVENAIKALNIATSNRGFIVARIHTLDNEINSLKALLTESDKILLKQVIIRVANLL